MKHLNGSKHLAKGANVSDSASLGSNPSPPANKTSIYRHKFASTRRTYENRTRQPDAQKSAQFPWTFFLTCVIAGIIMAAAVKGALGSTTVEAKVRFLSWCLQTHTLPICEHAWQPTNWLNVYKQPIEERRRKDAERLEAEPHWPNAAREWVPAVRPSVDLFRG